MSACTGYNSLAKARGLSPRTGGQTTVYLLLVVLNSSLSSGIFSYEMEKSIRQIRGVWFSLFYLFDHFYHTQKDIISQTDQYVVSLSSKTYIFEGKLTKYW